MTDLNATGPKNMSAHRQAETDVLCSQEFKQAVETKGLELLGYRMLQKTELAKMKRRYDADPYDKVVKEAVAAIKHRKP